MARLLAKLTYEEVSALVATGRAVAIVPVGSVEPHGPHLPLHTDTLISETCAVRAAEALDRAGKHAVVAPSVPYGVTDYASGFAGAIGVPAAALTAMLRGIAERLLATGFAHVCFVNNHLEPAHDAAVRASIAELPEGAATVACPLTRRWGRTLSDEFKRGDCHAGRYETSLVLAAGGSVQNAFAELPTLTMSLSEGIRAGKTTFAELGMSRAYTGAPREATATEGDELYEKLVTMVVTEVEEALAKRAPRQP
ncbi:Creatinine amidohydrolase [Labilithrix luteola]|uniref:Creatinine amidohydrolase n=1 Tax=Labilithrix luteola TaxID=1391654 RepID=A0A0K1QG38_9BACT|nr:creatininase family protein [Labilithrix luteola]AKV04719.1 Creatinine amidohydrolase [Labilithrix luteola]